MQRIFRICDFENAIICGKICDLHFLPKYAIAYSHITSIPNKYGTNFVLKLQYKSMLEKR